MSIMRKLVGAVARRKAKAIQYILDNPIEMTEDKLKEIVSKNSGTAIGKRFGFESIRNCEDYSEHVPLVDQHGMEPWLQKVYDHPTGSILTQEDVVWYLMSSGTTGRPKKIPITPTGMNDTKTGSMFGWLSYMNSAPGRDRVVEGTMVTFGAPAVIEHLNGIPVGYASGVYGKHQNKLFQRLIKPGPDVFNITDNEVKMWEYAKLIASSKTTAIQGITTLGLALIRRLQEMYGPSLLDEFKGTKYEERISKALDDDGRIELETLCPHLMLLGSSGIDVGPYREWLEGTHSNLKVWEFYGLSEAGIIGAQTYNEPGIQLYGNLNYMEFIPFKEIDKEHPSVIPMSEVKKGERYELVITSANGWYRYRPGDLLTFASTSPYTVHQIARKGRVVNMAGEKLSEAHVSRAIRSACVETGTRVMDYSVVGMIEDGMPFYTIAVLPGAGKLDTMGFLQVFEETIKESNLEFKIVRESGALGQTRLAVMRESYAEDMVRQTHLQAKPVPLTTDTKVLKMCEAYA